MRRGESEDIKTGNAAPETDTVKAILAEDKQRKKSFFLFLALSAVAGGIVGFAVGFTRYSFGDLQAVAKKAAAAVSDGSCYANLVLACAELLLFLPLYRSSRRLYASWDGEDEAVINKIESRLELAMSVVSVNKVLMLIFTVIGAQSMIRMADDGIFRTGMEICFHAGWILALTIMITGNKMAVNFEKEINPQKQGSVYDMRFRKKWFDSCDEAEKLKVYRASYASHRATGIACIGLCFFCLLGAILWGLGPLPMCIVGVIWLTDTITYCIAGYRINCGK